MYRQKPRIGIYTVEGPGAWPDRPMGRLHQTALLFVSSYVPRFLRVTRKAAMATMAATPTMGRTVARATLPPWLSPEWLDCVFVDFPELDCVCGTTVDAGVGEGGGGDMAARTSVNILNF